MTPTLDLASFDEIAAELSRRYPYVALIVTEQVTVDAKRFLERQAFHGEFNTLLGLIDTLHQSVMEKKKEQEQVV